MYYTFSALNGNKEAEMVLGYRYMHGIGTSRNCEEAVWYYSKISKRGNIMK